MINLIRLFSILVLILSGCTKPDPNPHLSDYIYKDIQKKLSNAEQIKGTHQQNYEDFLGKIKSSDPQSREHWLLSNKSFAAKWEAKKAQQKVDYFKMLLFDRERYVRNFYIKAFSKNETWDNSEELKLYKKSAQWEYSLTRASKAANEKKANAKPSDPEPSSGGH